MNAAPQIAEAFARLPGYLGGHVAVSLTALLIGLAISMPLAIASIRRPAVRNVLLGIASIVQTVPSLALLALFYPLLLGITALTERIFGVGFSALGFLPSVLALTLYSMLPVLRNTIAGLEGIAPAIKEAAQGVGMTPWQALIMVELPLAMPVIMAGIRTAAIWVIGAATLSTPIGQTSLGNYIFTGLQTQNWVFVLFGCAAAAIFALMVDQLLALMEIGLTRRKRGLVATGAMGLLLITAASLAPALSQQRATYIVGTKPFAEQYVLAALITQRLGDSGLSATTREGLGSAVIFNALRSGEIDVYVDYSGTIWANQMQRNDVKPRAEVLAEMKDWLQREAGVVLAGGLGFENAYALIMRTDRTQSLGIRAISDLAGRAPSMTIAGDYEFFGRPEWQLLRQAYGLSFRDQRTMQPEFMYAAAASGEADVIAGYTSDGRIVQNKLTVLEDVKHVIPPYDAVLLVSPRRANDQALLAALAPLVNSIDVAAMREANLRAANGASPAQAARWLWSDLESNRRRAN